MIMNDVIAGSDPQSTVMSLVLRLRIKSAMTKTTLYVHSQQSKLSVFAVLQSFGDCEIINKLNSRFGKTSFCIVRRR